jgi:hypothetical protein
MSNQEEDLLLSHDEDRPASTWRVPFPLLTPEATSKIASEMHRWGRMMGAFSIILIVIWLVMGATAAPSPTVGVTVVPAAGSGVAAVRSSLLWPGVVLAILAAIGLFGGFSFDYLAGHKR